MPNRNIYFVFALSIFILIGCSSSENGSESIPTAHQSPGIETHNETTINSPVVLFDEPVITPQSLAVIYNRNDPESKDVADYYMAKRGIPPENLVSVAFSPLKDPYHVVIYAPEFNQIYNDAISQLPPNRTIRAFALTWSNLYFVIGHASITTAFAYGIDPDSYCTDMPLSQPCSINPFNFYYNSVGPLFTGIRPTMMINAGDFELSKALIDRGVEADNLQLPLESAKGFGIYTGQRERSTRESSMALLGAKANYPGQLVFSYLDTRIEYPGMLWPGFLRNETNLMFYFTGLDWVPEIETNTYLPGAIADHMTSFGGVLDGTSQMTVKAWIAAGATASFGTVREAGNSPLIFPNPSIVVRNYMSREPLIAAYWKSVYDPALGLFMGEPLARPWKNTNSAYYSGGVTGTLSITTNSLPLGKSLLLEASDANGPYLPVKEIDNDVIGKVTVQFDNARQNYYYKLQPPVRLFEVASALSLATASVGILPNVSTLPVRGVDSLNGKVKIFHGFFPELAGFQIESSVNPNCTGVIVTGNTQSYLVSCTNCNDPMQPSKIYEFAEPIQNPEIIKIRYQCFEDIGFDINFMPGDINEDGVTDLLDATAFNTEFKKAIENNEYVNKLDFNEDGVINYDDREKLNVLIGYSQVINRQVFYKGATGSLFSVDPDGNPLRSIDASKNALIDTDLNITSSNYTNYVKGLNGIIIDINGFVGHIDASDFVFDVWNGTDSIGFRPTSAIPTITKIPFGGIGGSTRIKIEFADHAIQNTWLRVVVLPRVPTGLRDKDVFIFGNAAADVYVGNIGTPLSIRVNATDTSTIRQNNSIGINSVGIGNLYDLNKDGRVNATDTSLVRQLQNPLNIRFFAINANFGYTYEDKDGDGYHFLIDCDDNDEFSWTHCGIDADNDGHPYDSDVDDQNPLCWVHCEDNDHDGYPADSDCNDDNALVFGASCNDDDGDGYLKYLDCNDNNPTGWSDCSDNDADRILADTDPDDNDPNIPNPQ